MQEDRVKRNNTHYCDRCEGETVREDLRATADGWEELCEFCYEAHTREDEAGTTVYLPADSEAFTATYVKFHGWNGFHVPTFSYDEAMRVLRYIRDDAGTVEVLEIGTLGERWGKITYADLNSGDVVTMEPNERGGYVFDGWTWEFASERD
jgi:hypothetical protein